MRQDTANKTVSVLVVFAPEQVHNLTDFFGSEVFIFCDCKMQLAEDSSQSLWKANRGELELIISKFNSAIANCISRDKQSFSFNPARLLCG